MDRLKFIRGEKYSFSELAARLVELKYTRVDLVVDHGEFAVRGGIIDIFPVNQNTPLRLEFDGDKLESLRSFGIVDQRSIRQIPETEVQSAETQGTYLIRNEDFSEAEDHLLSEFSAGDFVVHENYGVAVFRGLQRLKAGSIEGEYYLLQYRDSEEVYIPIEQSSLIHSYTAAEGTPLLSSLTDKSWDKAKTKAKKAAKNIAFELFELYRQRKMTPGFAFNDDTEEQLLLEKDFPYTETRDQLRAIADVKQDMENEMSMDRLVCGEVGYGKTEIALRAVFKAVLSGKQAAILAPTTILVNQHYFNFKKRMEKFGVRIAMLSRFHTPAQNKEITHKIKAGSYDVVIGTHRILQKDIQFKDLGLLVIDEEQRFGVEHKEYIKKMRAGVDILTLSATPIPRTLYLSLSGARDMSVLETAPENRHPIKTILSEYNEDIVRKAIELELGRKGQVFFLHNNISEIEKIAGDLARLVPGCRILIGHGRMKKEQLEETILKFVEGEADVLVCTTIIENGIDIPRVNTIIVNNADCFGLAQLHQIRGRVGRSTIKAYAYFLYRGSELLAGEAGQRLHALKEFTALGVGYKIALRDLEIRGAGNILGAQQSGHIQSIGFTLYTKLLEESIRVLKGEKVEKEELFKLPTAQENFIPNQYMEEEELRISFYRRIMEAKSIGELSELHAELKDRFGRIPRATENLITNIRYQIQERRPHCP